MADTKKVVAKPDAFSWHHGEVTLQRHAGVADLMAALGPRIIRDHMPEQHRAFFNQLPNIVAGVVDESGDAWATVLCGDPGFVFSKDSTSLRIGALPYAGDPALRGVTAGEAIALLGIDLTNRRRNRVNGVVKGVGSGSFDMDVVQSFGNCPQYIHTREPGFIRDHRERLDVPAQGLSIADPRVRDLIQRAETLFIASYCDDGSDRQVDVSHKGGKQGFVKIDETGNLLIPDFAGNRHFNTLGNILLTPQCGLMFVDFAKGDVLQITGEGLVVLDATQIAGFDGAERLLRVAAKRLVFRPAALPLRWVSHKDGGSPSVDATGTWAAAEVRERLNQLGNT